VVPSKGIVGAYVMPKPFKEMSPEERAQAYQNWKAQQVKGLPQDSPLTTEVEEEESEEDIKESEE
jgi:hypothetical protein